jgi:protein-S-isoprenylcysteine O-methyltransferase Ste14
VGPDQDSKSLVVLWATILISIALGVQIGLQRSGQMLANSPVIAIVGLILIILGLILRWFAILSLGPLFTVDVAIMQGHHLVTMGIYKRVRHPSYSGALLSFLGLGLAFSNYLSTVVIFVPICIAFLYRIHVEEKALVATFGEEYLKYRASTKGLVPGVW